MQESNAWRKRCVFRPDSKTGKEQGARSWSGKRLLKSYSYYAGILKIHEIHTMSATQSTEDINKEQLIR